MTLPAGDLKDPFFEVRDFDWETLAGIIAVSKLAELTSTPCVDLTLVIQRNRVAFTTLYIDYVHVM
jgi:hypothetical protein